MAMDIRDKVLEGYYFFDNKHLIMKPWDAEMNMENEELPYLPVWIQLRLNFKYQDERALFKIVRQIGQPLKRDDATKNRDKLQYARVLVEYNMKQKLPDQLQLLNEHGEMNDVGIHYEWKLEYCDNCRMVGHVSTDCRKLKTKKKWVANLIDLVIIEKPSVMPVQKAAEVDQEGFQRALKPIKVRVSQVQPTQTANGFNVLNGVEDHETGELQQLGRHLVENGSELLEGEDSLTPNGQNFELECQGPQHSQEAE